MSTPRYGRINLSLAAIVPDADDPDTLPDRVPLNGVAVLRPRLAPGGGEIGRGPFGDEVQIPTPATCSVIDGVLTHSGKPYITLLVPTEAWFWEVSFTGSAVDDVPLLLDSFAFPVTEATEAQLSDEAFAGTNIAPFASLAWQSPLMPAGAQRLAAEMATLLGDGREVAQQINVIVANATSAAQSASLSAQTASTKATEASVSRATAADRAAAATLSETAAASSASAAAGSATAASGSKTAAAGSAAAAENSKTAAANSATAARTAADEFALTFPTPTTVAPGQPATVTVTKSGAAYTVQLGLPKGDKGDTGNPTTPATTSAIGSVQLAGNLSGTAAAPTVTVPGAGGGRQQLDSFASAVHAALPTKADLSGGKVVASQLPDPLVSSVAGKTGTVTLAKGDVGLGSVDNTSDASKPVSTAQQAALDDKAGAARAGVKLWYGTEAEYAALPAGTKNAVGFIAVILP